jgi:hypothetical protein
MIEVVFGLKQQAASSELKKSIHRISFNNDGSQDLPSVSSPQ